MAQIALGLKIPMDVYQWFILVEKVSNSSILEEDHIIHAMPIQVDEADWRTPIIEYLKNPNADINVKIKRKAIHIYLIDDELFKKGADESILQCPGYDKTMRLMKQVHSGLCGAHQVGTKMR